MSEENTAPRKPNAILRRDAQEIISRAIAAVQPDEAVARALAGKEFPGRVFLSLIHI